MTDLPVFVGRQIDDAGLRLFPQSFIRHRLIDHRILLPNIETVCPGLQLVSVIIHPGKDDVITCRLYEGFIALLVFLVSKQDIHADDRRLVSFRIQYVQDLRKRFSVPAQRIAAQRSQSLLIDLYDDDLACRDVSLLIESIGDVEVGTFKE